MTKNKVRVRFAPSPTGPLHIGGVRTALYNYLFARKNEGSFILRIEDTDQNRYVPGAEDYIVESLKWCKIQIHEGVTANGKLGPYRQSERKEIYKKYVLQLVDSGRAYYAFDTTDELDQMRDVMTKKGVGNPQYDWRVRNEMHNSLNMSQEALEKKLHEQPYVVRFKMPENEMVKFHDLIRGDVEVNSSTLDDKILFKSDGMPTYHLANVVDDHLMEISHVIRGEEWLPSTPLHYMLYKAFGWEKDMPEFAHLPLLLKPSGNGKLSKRDGDKMGFPVFPLQWTSPNGEIYNGYREAGYFAEAFVNILAFLGWNPGTEQEVFSMKELEESFSLERVGKAGARFDPDKAKWFNQQYLRSFDNLELVPLLLPVLSKKGFDVEPGYVARVIELVKDRVHFIHEIWDQAYYFFKAPETYDPKVVKKRWKENTPDNVLFIKDRIAGIDPFKSEQLEETVKACIEERELGMGQMMNALRLCVVGTSMGPHLFDIMEMIGKEETLHRLEKGVNEIKK